MEAMGFLFIIVVCVLLYFLVKNLEKTPDPRPSFISEEKRLRLENAINRNFNAYLLFVFHNISIWRVSDKRVNRSIKIRLHEQGINVYLQYIGLDDESYEVSRFVSELESSKATKNEVMFELRERSFWEIKLNRGDKITCGYEINPTGNKRVTAVVLGVEKFGVLVKTSDSEPCKLFNNRNVNLIEFCYLQDNGVLSYRPKNREVGNNIWLGSKFRVGDIIMYTVNSDGTRGHVIPESEYKVMKITSTSITYLNEDGKLEVKSSVEFDEWAKISPVFKWIN